MKIFSLIFAGLYFVLKVVFWLLKAIVMLLGEIIIFFGLYLPALYLIFGAFLSKYTSFSFSTPSTELNLFYLGLGLCIVFCLIITIRKLILFPLSRINQKFTKRAKHEFVEDAPKYKSFSKKDDTQKEVEETPQKQEPQPEKKGRKKREEEQPLIYKSKMYPDITVYEYKDRFDLYKEDEELGRKFIKTEYKKNNKRRQ